MGSPYRKLLLALIINTALMFVITYALIAEVGHFHADMALFAAFALVLASVLTLARTQTLIGDRQFLRSMIPHHSSAILMCERARITDPEIRRLCDQIIRSQEEEIAQMERMLAR